ncbi:hypothetical protein SCLCIDRAFT_1207735 [Scleroderma citrinum Foug A]|uniref:Uncharacterized protein n=1 Tax=Scleroderma citrinum Foug A TaxID=1036808 RepID=A0A0C3AZG0_9AGAM|nr:hypothetical protein SCLCIDRAFT_1207735 [Scleroderma citrinum Foug A]
MQLARSGPLPPFDLRWRTSTAIPAHHSEEVALLEERLSSSTKRVWLRETNDCFWA